VSHFGQVMSPAPATIFKSPILNRISKPLTNSQPSLLISHNTITIYHSLCWPLSASSTFNMSNKSWKTDDSNVPKLTEEFYGAWKPKICQVFISNKAYIILTGVKLLPFGHSIVLYPLQDTWHDTANKAIALIHIGCCDKLLPLIDDISDPVEMWKVLRDWFDNTSTNLSQTNVLWKFTTCRPSQDRMVTQYCTKVITFRKKLICTTDNITDDANKTQIFTTQSNLYEQTLPTLQQRIPAPTAQNWKDAIYD